MRVLCDWYLVKTILSTLISRREFQLALAVINSNIYTCVCTCETLESVFANARMLTVSPTVDVRNSQEKTHAIYHFYSYIDATMNLRCGLPSERT
jgi:hypothetical protein